MGGRGASSMKNNHESFITKMMREANDMTRGDLQGVVEAYAMSNGLDSKWENETLAKIDKANTILDNKDRIIDFVKHQTKIDLSKYIEEKTVRSRTYLGVHLEKLGINQRNEVMQLLKYKKGLRVEDNGGYGFAIYYKK